MQGETKRRGATYNPDSKGRRVVVRQSGKPRCLRPNSKAETGPRTLAALLALASELPRRC